MCVCVCVYDKKFACKRSKQLIVNIHDPCVPWIPAHRMKQKIV